MFSKRSEDAFKSSHCLCFPVNFQYYTPHPPTHTLVRVRVNRDRKTAPRKKNTHPTHTLVRVKVNRYRIIAGIHLQGHYDK